MTWKELTLNSAATDGWNPTGLDRLAKDGGLLRARGPVATYDSFDDGSRNGWRNHFSFSRPYPPVAPVTYPTVHGTHAMRLSPGDSPLGTATSWESTGTYRNLSKFRDTGLASWSCFFAWAGDGSLTELQYPFSSIDFMFDTQRWDSSSRSFYRFSYTPSTAPMQARWKIKDSAGSNVIVPNSDMCTAGGNERKMNWNYVRFTIDQDANGGTGGYHELQVNSRVFDLRGLGAGAPADTPISGSSWDNFSGGHNLGIAVTRATAYPDLTNVEVLFDEVVTTFDDKRAA